MSTIDLRIGRYVLIEPVGRGAMGVVYRAEDPLIHRSVAVKVLHPAKGLSPLQIQIARERFDREAETAGSIDHPNIVRIFDVGEEAETGDMYIVMEFLSGPSLERMLDEAPIPLERASTIIGQIASGLDAAHARGIIHRDIKPSNILFNDHGTAKLADFGITQVATSSLTQDMRSLGTPAYMSPEQVSGKRVDSRADLFSLGVVSYEILTGRKAFEGNDTVSIAYAIAHAESVPVSLANPELPQALDGVFARILAKDPSERFASGREFHEALASCLVEGGVPRFSTHVRVSTRWKGALAAAAVVVAITALAVLRFSGGAPAVPPAAPAVPPAATTAPLKATVAPPTAPAPSRAAAPSRAPTPSRATVKKAASARAPVPTADITISLSHRLRTGTLVVSLDGKPIFTEKFQKARLALQQTTTWDKFKAPAGSHTLRATVRGDNGKVYLSETQSVELPRATGTAIRIGFQRDRLTIKQSSG